jgi:hypothetical protein
VASEDASNAAYTEYCFDLQYWGTTEITSARPSTAEWCAAQKTVNRVEFLSQPACSKTMYTAVYYKQDSADAIPLGVEDQYVMGPDGVTPVVNEVKNPFDGSVNYIPRTAMKAVKVGAYLAQYGYSFAELEEPAEGGFTPAGRFCLRLKKDSACASLRDFCGGSYYYYQASAPPSEVESVRCEWSIMEGVNQKCCPTQTTLQVL